MEMHLPTALVRVPFYNLLVGEPAAVIPEKAFYWLQAIDVELYVASKEVWTALSDCINEVAPMRTVVPSTHERWGPLEPFRVDFYRRVYCCECDEYTSSGLRYDYKFHVADTCGCMRSSPLSAATVERVHVYLLALVKNYPAPVAAEDYLGAADAAGAAVEKDRWDEVMDRERTLSQRTCSDPPFPAFMATNVGAAFGIPAPSPTTVAFGDFLGRALRGATGLAVSPPVPELMTLPAKAREVVVSTVVAEVLARWPTVPTGAKASADEVFYGCDARTAEALRSPCSVASMA